MSTNEIKCPNCSRWTPGNHSHCVHCGALVDYRIIDQQKRASREAERIRRKEANPTRLEKYLKKIKHSKNPAVRFLYHVLNVVWTVYMALMAFIIWFTAIFSG